MYSKKLVQVVCIILSPRYWPIRYCCPAEFANIPTPLTITQDSLTNSHRRNLSINVWFGIVHDLLTGPYRLPARLTGPVYGDFLEHSLPQLLGNVPLHVCQRMWFMHNKVSALFQHVCMRIPDHFLCMVDWVRWSFFLACLLT